jgi:hypothetical protein
LHATICLLRIMMILLIFAHCHTFNNPVIRSRFSVSVSQPSNHQIKRLF